MRKEIKFHCATVPGDHIRFTDDVLLSEERCVSIHTCSFGNEQSVVLSAGDARRLFGWLGVWLHQV